MAFVPLYSDGNIHDAVYPEKYQKTLHIVYVYKYVYMYVLYLYIKCKLITITLMSIIIKNYCTVEKSYEGIWPSNLWKWQL